MPIQVYDVVESRVVAIGTGITDLGNGNVGVTNCQVQPGQRLQVNYSYLLKNTTTGTSQSAECTALPGGGMMTASFHLN
jgi:hypothetical protein